MIAAWWHRLFGCEASDRRARKRVVDLQRLADMNFAEACNANRLMLDRIEHDARTKTAIDEMVESMTRGRTDARSS